MDVHHIHLKNFPFNNSKYPLHNLVKPIIRNVTKKFNLKELLDLASFQE